MPEGSTLPMVLESLCHSLPHQPPAAVWWIDGAHLRAALGSDGHFYSEWKFEAPSSWDNLTSLPAVFPIGFWDFSERRFSEGQNSVLCERADKQGPG